MNMSARIKTALLSKFIHQDGKVNYSSAAKAIGVTRQAIMHWVNHSPNEIKVSNIVKLSEVTGYSQNWLVTGTVSNDQIAMMESTPSYALTYSDQESWLVEQFRKLTHEQQDAVCIVMQSMPREFTSNNGQ